MNISTYSDNQTANTSYGCALQRAENLAALNVKTAIELCVGPSLKILERVYSKFGISVVGNDIEPRWKKFYPKGEWIIGDARAIDVSKFDAVIIAPPLSKNCSGRREDSLRLDYVFPKYESFLHLTNKVVVYVLPGRTLSLKEDRSELYRFVSRIKKSYDIIPLIDKVIKYVDIYSY